MMPYKQTNLIFTPETKLCMAFHSCLSREYSYLVFKDFPIEFHAELKNELFLQGHHISQFITLTVFVIQTNCLQLYIGPLLVF